MEITVNEIAALVNGKTAGNGEAKVCNFAKIEEAGPGDLTFIANPKYEHFIHTTLATAVLVREDFPESPDFKGCLIKVADPYKTLADLLTYVESMKCRPQGIEQPCFIAEGVEIPEGCYVGAFAYIGKGVKLGKGVSVYPQAYVGDGVSIGEGTVIRSGVRIYEKCSIGSRCIIHSGAVIGADGFGFAPVEGGYEKIPQIGGVVIADDVEIGANTCIDRATFGNTVVESGTKLDNLIQVAHNVKIGKANVFAAQTGIAGSTSFGDFNQIGGQCGFAGHIHVGNCNQIGAQSGIPNSVGDNKRLMGYPVVDARQFAKTQVYLKKLPELFDK